MKTHESFSRRKFLVNTALAAGSVAVRNPDRPAAVGVATPANGASWYDRPMRWAQLTLVEDDPGQYDPAFWLDYFRRTHSDAACLSAGGCVAYYPTRVPLHYRSKYLGDRDCFGELVAGCRKLGMNVIARTDPHAAHQDVYDAHPDWIAVDAQDKKRRHWADPEMWVTCGLGPYNFEFMTEVTREVMRLYNVDGVFSNRWAGSGMCYCEHCRRNFKKFSGLELPRSANPRDEARRQYVVWRQRRLFELWRLWDAEIKKINENASFIANAGGGALSDLDMKTIGELAPTLFADRQARRGLMPPWMNGKNGKEYGATMGGKAIVGIFSVGLEEPYRWKDSVQSGDEIRLWVVDGIAHNLRPWFTKFNGKVIDHRWLKVVEDLYGWHYKNERYLRNERSLARVAMVYSQQTASFYGGEQARARVEDHALGFYQALVEARIPFDMAHDHLLDPSRIGQYRTLILPNIAALSSEQCQQIIEFVQGGGSVVATYETSLYDEWGARRADFGLAELFGASFDGRVDTGVHNSYLNVEKDPRSGLFHPIVQGLEDATRIINGVNWVHARPHNSNAEKPAYSPLTLVPSYPDLPMEEVFPRVARTDIPGVFAREVGRGRVVYFPFDIDRTFWETLATDHALVLRNAVTWASNEEQPLVVKGRGMLDVSLWMQKDSITAHLVNLTNPMMMKGPVREIIPAPRQEVRVRPPDGRRIRKARFLVSGKTPIYHESGGVVSLTIPSIDLHEVIALDLV
ncbi:MAG: beta-galactosidase trimerization domain-containing protein [Chloracidobacterium sp.]|nr:beta-galactosidase trimerization domain-containing protein [Chloracidobacterium sp.]